MQKTERKLFRNGFLEEKREGILLGSVRHIGQRKRLDNLWREVTKIGRIVHISALKFSDFLNI
jgi:hypothetical protein